MACPRKLVVLFYSDSKCKPQTTLELGWIAQRNVNFALRVAEGQIDRLPGFASEMVSLNVDVIAVIGAVTVRAVQKATSTIPIVYSVVVEPVGDGTGHEFAAPGS